MVGLVSGQEVKEHGRLVEGPFAPPIPAPEYCPEQLLGGETVEKCFWWEHARRGSRRHGDAVDAELVSVSKNAATRSGSASLKKVQLIVARKPFDLAVFNAETARS